MNERKRILILILIMVVVVFVATGITISILYNAALKQGRERLVETAQSQARLIEAVARFDAVYSHNYPEGSTSATISQVVNSHKNFKGFGDTGEFTLAKREGGQISFILSHRHFDLEKPQPVPFDSTLAEPMRKALSGVSGSLIGIDYRGELVLAAHEPVAVLDLGIVAKIDLKEIRAPFIKASLMAASAGFLLIIISSILFLRISDPIVRRLKDYSETLEKRTTELASVNDDLSAENIERKHAEEKLHKVITELKKALHEVKALKGLIPICMTCKKIRDDKGYWNKVETYISQHTQAAFSHGICPECAEKMKEDENGCT